MGKNRSFKMRYFKIYEKNIYKIRVVFILFIEIFYILGILGLFYPIKIFNLEFTPLLEKIIIDFSFFSLFLFILIFIITLFFGRIYCSIICPMGILQEIFLVFISFTKKFYKKKNIKKLKKINSFKNEFDENEKISYKTKEEKNIKDFNSIFSVNFNFKTKKIKKFVFPKFLDFLKLKNDKVKFLFSKYLKYFIAFLFVLTIFNSAKIIRHIDPYTIFSSSINFRFFSIISIFIILNLALFKNRFFCTKLCPVGTILGIISKISIYKIQIDNKKCISCKMCINSCQTKCIEEKNSKIKINNENCIKCLKCLNVCKNDAIKFRKFKENEFYFDKDRRDFLKNLGTISTFGSIYFLTKKLDFLNFEVFSKFSHSNSNQNQNFSSFLKHKNSQNNKNIILPPGATDKDRMKSKCLNCYLCINNCKNMILSKANSDFNRVHIDYSIGKGYCEYNCNKCSSVCPTGAIKNLSLEEKQNLKIAAAVITGHCIGCGVCSGVCPRDAIEWVPGALAKIDANKCIGCSKCAKNCKMKAIEIIPIYKQIFLD